VIAPRQLPASSSAFCGRTAALAHLGELLNGVGTRHTPLVIAIDGPAGVGKSALALAAAHQVASRFPDGQLYHNLQGATPGLKPLRAVEVLGRFLRALGVHPQAVPADEAEAAALFRSLVADRRVLVMLDDAGSLAQVRPLLPGGHRCATVVTGRTAFTGLMEATCLHLQLMAPEESFTLLERIVGVARATSDVAATTRLASLCGHLPLALRIAGARLAARPDWPVAALADRLEAGQRRLDELSAGDVAVRASIELTYRGLAEESRRALRRLALSRAPDFAPWALAALLDVPPVRAEQLLDDLLAVHLLEVASPESAHTRYRFHDLVRLFAQERAAEEDPLEGRRAALRRMVEACVSLAERANQRYGADFVGVAQPGMEHWSLPDVEVERLTADPGGWFEREHPCLIAAVDAGLDIGASGAAGSLAVSLTTFFELHNHFADWRRVQTRALAVAARSRDHRTAMKLHRGLGELDTIQDRYADAIEHFEAALGFGTADDPQYEAALTAGLGSLHRLRGEYGPAHTYFTRARRLTDETGNLNGLVYATNGVGIVHLERGRLAEATDCFDECLRISRSNGYLPGEAQNLRSLGHVHRANNRYDDAAELYRRAGEISVALGDRLGEAHAHCWLGEMRVRQGRHPEGRKLLTRCLWVYREFGNAWGEAATLSGLAAAQLAVARPRAALGRARQAVSIWRRIGSPNWLAHGLDTLGGAYDGLGDHAAARRARREAAGLRRRLDAG
jgi:tetratricopeptide (TPR) repeat protein